MFTRSDLKCEDVILFSLSVPPEYILLFIKKLIKKNPKLITFLFVLLLRMKLQTQLNTCRLPSFSYSNPFLFLRHSCPVPHHPPSKLLFQALLSRNFYLKSFRIAGTYSVVSISSSKSYLKIY